MVLNVVAKIAIMVAASAAQMALAASQKIEGPRLDSLDANLGDFGAPLPRFWGISRFDGCPIIWAEKLKEKKKKSKTKGGKYAEYKYYGTWAVAIADHQIDAVRGIWLDRHLCYQMRGIGPLTPILGILSILGVGGGDAPVKLSLGTNLRLQLGTETQTPIHRYEAWCEDRYGEPDMAPAYLGVAVAYFIDIPLEKFGNRLPQVSIEAVNSKVDDYPVESVPYLAGINTLQFTPDFSRLYLTRSGGPVQVFDVATRTKILEFASGANWLGFGPLTMYSQTGFPAYNILSINYDGGEVSLATGSFGGPFLNYAYYVGGMACFTPYAGLTPGTFFFDGLTVQAQSRSFIANHYFEDLDGNGWACGEVPGQNKVGFVHMPGGDLLPEHLVDTTATGAAYAMANADGTFLVLQAGKLFTVDPETWTASAPVAVTLGTSGPETIFRNISPGASSIWLHNNEHDTSDGSLIRTVSLGSWGSFTGGLTYDPVNHALIHAGGTLLSWLYLDRVSSDGVALSTVISDVCDLSGIEHYDASALDQLVKGYAVVQGTGREMIEPLLSAHFASARPHDFSLQFIKLGSPAAGETLLTEDFAALGSDSRFSAIVATDKDLPRKVTVNFADPGKDYQTNNVIAQRGLDEVSAKGDRSLDMTTYVGTPDEMRPLGDRYFRQLWLERETDFTSHTPDEIALEPGDVRTISLDGKERTVRAEKVTFTAGALKVEWKRTHPSLASLSTNPGAPMDGRDPDTVYIPGPTKGLALDIPLVSDAHDLSLPQIYYGAGKYLTSASWPGATFFKGDVTGSVYSDFAEISSSSGMTWGYATEALAAADPWLWDRGNSVNVDVRGGTLSSVTEADIETDPSVNLAYLGGELLNFTTATLELDGTYTLSGFKRGRRGTEGACPTHGDHDEFVLVSSLVRAGLGLSEVGTTEYFKAATLGQEPDAVPAITFPFTGATLKPLAPARVKWSTDGTDLFGEIIRRTRLGGSWTDSGAVPLSENVEEYEVDVLDGGGSVIRTIAVSGSNTFTYTAAAMAADGFSLSNRPEMNVYQMSDAVGRGFALAA